MSATVGHCEYDDVDVYIGRREGGSQTIREAPPGRCWGNPYRLEDHSRTASVKKFATLLERLLEERPVYRLHVARLHGQTLGCYCRRVDDTEPVCHGDVLAAHAERVASEIAAHQRGEDGPEPCSPDKHELVAYSYNGRRSARRTCARCGYGLQSLVGWFDQDISGGASA